MQIVISPVITNDIEKRELWENIFVLLRISFWIILLISSEIDNQIVCSWDNILIKNLD